MCADDLLIFSPSVIGLQYMLDCCYEYGQKQDILFNPRKSVCLAAGGKSYAGAITVICISGTKRYNGLKSLNIWA